MITVRNLCLLFRLMEIHRTITSQRVFSKELRKISKTCQRIQTWGHKTYNRKI